MQIRKYLKKYPIAVQIYRRFSRLRANLSLLGLFPIRTKRIVRIPHYLRDRYKFKKMGGIISYTYPIIDEYSDSAGSASGHYFHQDLIVAQQIFNSNPVRHIDVGSRIDGFVAHVASFRKIEIFDIRALPDCGHKNIVFQQIDLMDTKSEKPIADSISCLHTVEHFGLGRYGDTINPRGYILGFESLINMLQSGGKLYISFPISKNNEVHFNAHRSFKPMDILSWAQGRVELIRFDYVDDDGNIQMEIDLFNTNLELSNGCGIYTFKKL